MSSFTQEEKQDCYTRDFIVPGIHIEHLSAIKGKPIQEKGTFFRIYEKDTVYWVYRAVIWRIEYRETLKCPFNKNGIYFDDWNNVEVVDMDSYVSVTRKDWYRIILADIKLITKKEKTNEKIK